MKKTITSTLIAGAAAAALMGAGTAAADVNDVAFIDTLASRGIGATNGGDLTLIKWGMAVCVGIAAGDTPTQVANMIYAKTPLSGYDSNYFVGAAVAAYCPQFRRYITG